jgi:hypothetical protein
MMTHIQYVTEAHYQAHLDAIANGTLDMTEAELMELVKAMPWGVVDIEPRRMTVAESAAQLAMLLGLNERIEGHHAD